jgi:hypothetical protein
VQCHSSLILTHLTSMKVKGLGSNFRCSKSDCQAGILMAGVFGRTREKALCYLYATNSYTFFCDVLLWIVICTSDYR